jgi:hypothetical protein
MKTIGIYFIILISLIIIANSLNVIGVRSGLCKDVNGEKIEQVKVGMTLEQVIHILGRPVKINSNRGMHKIGCKNPRPWLNAEISEETDIRKEVDKIYNDTNYCCEGNRTDLQDKFVTLTYSKPVLFTFYYPMLWVHLDRNFKVKNVYAKQYDGILGFDDECIYCDGVINQKKFSNCFY